MTAAQGAGTHSGRPAPRPFLIGDRWISTTDRARVVNPFSGELLAEVCQAGKTEADLAAQTALTAFPALRQLPAHARAGALTRIVAQLEACKESLARSITAEAGKPITDARREVQRAIQTFTVASEEAKRIPGEVIPMDAAPGGEGYLGVVRRFPIGPVLGITPFNFPLNLVAHKVAPALAVGNPIVLKPAPQTPLTALMLAEIVLESGLPPGALSVVPCGNAVAEQMVMDPRFRLLSFTGSAPVGWMLKAKSGTKRVLLELGGNAGVIVEPDADLDLAVERCAVGGFGYAGQSCISVQRIFVQDSVFDRFVERLVARVGRIRTGDPSDEATVIGPLIDETAARRVESWIGEAIAQGARVLTGGKRVGPVLDATILTDVKSTMKISCQEVFGPVVTVSRYRHFEEALAALNDSEFGLQAGVFTKDVTRIFRAYRVLEVGTLLANEIPTFRLDHMPYGGVKQSGLGREGVRYTIEEMTEPKLLVLNLKESNPG
jgi:acyl-CoA reductase-like NAD-dependent aldehyde dehydrogenase